MGSWGHKVGESDTFADVYDQFFDEYNNGATAEAMDTLVEIPAPDGKKVFSVSEQYSNGRYIHTGATMMSDDNGGSVFYFTKQGAKVSARWLDSQNLEVTIEKGLAYSKRDDWAFFCGDKVDIRYEEV